MEGYRVFAVTIILHLKSLLNLKHKKYGCNLEKCTIRRRCGRGLYMLMYYCNLLITQLNTTVVVVSRWINNCPKFICFFAPSIVQHTLACMLAWLQPKLTIAYVEREREKNKDIKGLRASSVVITRSGDELCTNEQVTHDQVSITCTRKISRAGQPCLPHQS
jgi:hypothetical protein